MKRLDKLFKNFDINNVEIRNAQDEKAKLILTVYSDYFNKPYPKGACKGQFMQILRTVYNEYNRQKEGKKTIKEVIAEVAPKQKELTYKELKEMAKELNLKFNGNISKAKLITLIEEAE